MGSPGGPMPLGPPWGPPMGPHAPGPPMGPPMGPILFKILSFYSYILSFYSYILSFYSQILSFYSQILSFIAKKYRFTVGFPPGKKFSPALPAKIFFRLHDRGGPMGPQIYDLYVLYTQKYAVFHEFSESGIDLSEFYG